MSSASAGQMRKHESPRAARRLEGLARPRRPEATAAPPRESVSRPELVARLIESPASVALIAAPAGYGKTILAHEWDVWDARPFAWVTLDEEHETSSGALVAAIEEALDDVAPAGSPPRGASPRSRRGPAPVALARLVRSLGARRRFVIMLDDLQALRTNAAREIVRSLARHVPAGSALAVCSRCEPALPVGRLRANRQLVEVRARDLVMTSDEAAMLLELSGVRLERPLSEELARKTEGWPAGIYLAALALRGQSDMAAAVERFGGDDTIVADYLRDEVLSQMRPESVEFLVRASLLDRMSGPVCDAVLGRSGSARLLTSIGREDLLLVPLDRRGESYRCHHLLGRMLGGELRRTAPEEAVRLHRRASDWYAAHADVDRAMHHAVAAEDAGRAGELLAANAPEYVTHGRNRRVERWLGSFSAEQIAAHPALSLAAGNSQLLKGNLAEVGRWESAARRVLHETAPRERSAELEASVAILHAIAAREGAARMGKDAARGYGLVPEDSPWRPICCLVEGVSRHLTGAREAAEARLLEGVRRGTVAAPNIQTLCLAQLALLTAERNDWENAAGYAARALGQVEHYALREYPTSALVFAVSAAVRARRGRIEEAREDARQSALLLRMLTDFMAWYEVETRLALAEAAIRLSDTAAARAMVFAAERPSERMPDAVVLHEWIERLQVQLEAAPATPAPLTTAELRILRFLPTHLSFKEIADRLYVSANTVKSQAHAVYRKLEAGSRSEAVTRAKRLGLLDD